MPATKRTLISGLLLTTLTVASPIALAQGSMPQTAASGGPLASSEARSTGANASAPLALGPRDYLTAPGLDVIVFDDIYPDGHQTGVTIIQHGQRVVANGDVRLDHQPGQWSPMPVSAGQRTIDRATGRITQKLRFPDPSKNAKGFNPIFYPDLNLDYSVAVQPAGGNSFRILVTLDTPIPAAWAGIAGFNLELFPAHLFGRGWIMDGRGGTFPTQPVGPVVRQVAPGIATPRNTEPNGPVPAADGLPMPLPLATGRSFTMVPEDARQRIQVDAVRGANLSLIDGRAVHNNGWYILRADLPTGVTGTVLEWVVTPTTLPDWKSDPTIQVSQLGYAPEQPKQVVIELDPRDSARPPVVIEKLTPNGPQTVLTGPVKDWGNFLRYTYATFDFSSVKEPGLYQVRYGDSQTHTFRIDKDVFGRDAWATTLEYFLPVQMCHMEVREKYRIWHGLDHLDDATMAPVGLNHFDGYVQGPETLTRFKSGDHVPGLNVGGWHDAGDYDLRVESQAGTIWALSKMVEEFGLNHDSTRVDQAKRRVELRDPDGRNDAIQQIEHGLLSVVGGWKAMGRLYRGLIEPNLRTYVMLGDAALQSDNIVGKPVDGLGDDANGKPITTDDRWVFTEDNPNRELYVAGSLAAAARVMKADNPGLAKDTLDAAIAVADAAFDRATNLPNRVFAAAELFQTTGDKRHLDRILTLRPDILAKVRETGWYLASIEAKLPADFRKALSAAVKADQAKLNAEARTDSPYGVVYKPNIWGAGWDIQRRGMQQWFFHKGWPNHTDRSSVLNALNFVLGAHPGSNTESFVSGVGARSALVAYGTNRADWSFIPGGVISGTNLVRPDLPELKQWPFFWQQGEYVMGGGETNYMFLALAADRMFNSEKK